MESKSFSSLEATFLSNLNLGHNTFDKLKDNVPFNEKTLSNVIESMIAKNIIKFNPSSKEYCYSTPVSGEVVILDGNIMLPVSIIKTKTDMLITRGSWYKFPLDFDTRRIIWNVQLPNNNKSTLVELIQNSILKEKKSKILQLPEYQNLVGKLVPYSEGIKIKLNVIGEDLCDVTLLIIKKLQFSDSEDYTEFRNFTVKSEIKTQQLINELTKSSEERNYKNIEINRIYNFSDFVFSNNSIPYLYDGESINYVTLTSIRKKIELTYYRFDNTGKTTKIDSEEFFDASEGIEKIRELFNGYAETLLIENDLLVEITE